MFVGTQGSAWSDSVPLAKSQVVQSLWVQMQQLTVVDSLLYRKREDAGGGGRNLACFQKFRYTVYQCCGRASWVAETKFYWVGQRKMLKIGADAV